MSTGAVIATVVGALGAFFGGCAALIKWALGRWEESQKQGREDAKANAAALMLNNAATREALVANTASNTLLSAKLEQLVTGTADLARKIDGISDFVQEHTPVNQPVPQRRTPAGGIPAGQYGLKRNG